MLSHGDQAPDTALPGYADGSIETYRLEDTIARGNVALVLFYPFDFSPVCTTELCAIRDAEWFTLTDDLSVWAISADSVYAHRAFAEEHDIGFPLLSDSNGRVADSFGVCYDEWEGHESVPKRAVFLVDPDRTIRYAWSTDDAFEQPDFVPVKEALDTIEAESLISLPSTTLSVDYDGELGEKL